MYLLFKESHTSETKQLPPSVQTVDFTVESKERIGNFAYRCKKRSL